MSVSFKKVFAYQHVESLISTVISSPEEQAVLWADGFSSWLDWMNTAADCQTWMISETGEQRWTQRKPEVYLSLLSRLCMELSVVVDLSTLFQMLLVNGKDKKNSRDILRYIWWEMFEKCLDFFLSKTNMENI